MKSRLFGSSLVSVPFCVEGGVLAAHADIEAALLNEASSLAQRLAVDYLELRNRVSCNMNWPAKDLYVSFRKEISSDNEANMADIPRKQRAMVRGGIKNSLESVESDDWSRLFRTYSESVRNLGTPVFARRYFGLLAKEFGQDCRILMVTHEGRDIAGVMSFYFRDEVLPYYGGSKSIARSLKANDFMYWELMRRSADQGIRLFDFGRSKRGTGSFNFKKNWGFTPEQLHYEYCLVKASSVPELNPTNPRYAWAIENWKKLPLPVANVLGPLLSRTLG
jgi:FemAB-related protein (PEP-CTERM system-associated)